jgi:hypothetical protein
MPPLELSPIRPLLARLTPAQRHNSLSIGKSIERHQAHHGWDGEVVLITAGLGDIASLPVLSLDGAAIGRLHIAKHRATYRADAFAMLYHDAEGAPWCIRLDGPGIPILQEDLFHSWARLAVLT